MIQTFHSCSGTRRVVPCQFSPLHFKPTYQQRLLQDEKGDGLSHFSGSCFTGNRRHVLYNIKFPFKDQSLTHSLFLCRLLLRSAWIIGCLLALKIIWRNPLQRIQAQRNKENTTDLFQTHLSTALTVNKFHILNLYSLLPSLCPTSLPHIHLKDKNM